jgi:hypothetical protein
MRRAAILFIVLSLAAGPVARAAERVLTIEAEVLGPKEKSVGKTQVLVAARGTERAKGEFPGVTLVLDADVGPTFDKDCNLVTVSGRLEEPGADNKVRKHELKRVTIQACGTGTKPTTLSGDSTHQVVVTIRPAS